MQLALERIYDSLNCPSRSQIAVHLAEDFWQTNKQKINNEDVLSVAMRCTPETQVYIAAQSSLRAKSRIPDLLAWSCLG